MKSIPVRKVLPLLLMVLCMLYVSPIRAQNVAYCGWYRSACVSAHGADGFPVSASSYDGPERSHGRDTYGKRRRNGGVQ